MGSSASATDFTRLYSIFTPSIPSLLLPSPTGASCEQAGPLESPDEPQRLQISTLEDSPVSLEFPCNKTVVGIAVCIPSMSGKRRFWHFIPIASALADHPNKAEAEARETQLLSFAGTLVGQYNC